MAAELHAAPLPTGFPKHQLAQREVAWIGLTTESLDRAHALFVDALKGDVLERGEGWLLISWGPGRTLLMRHAGATPGGRRLWAGVPAPGVAHVVFGPATLSPANVIEGRFELRPLPFDRGTQIAVWVGADET
jgi:hypothetical protein